MKKPLQVWDKVMFFGFTSNGWWGDSFYQVIEIPTCTSQIVIRDSNNPYGSCNIDRRQVTHVKRKKKKVQPRFVGWSRHYDEALDGRYSVTKSKHDCDNCAVFIIEEKDLTPEIKTKWNIKE